MKITTGKIIVAQKVVVYGVEGIGKTTFASKFPDPVFIDTEGSTKFLDVKRFEAPSSWNMLLSQIDYVIKEKPCKTLVIDTIDWAEKLCCDHILAANNWKSIETPGYGSGYRYVYEEMGKLLNKLSDVIGAGINVVITAHSALRRAEQPSEYGSYDRYEMKLQNSQKCNTAAMVKEWADCVLFVNYRTIVTDINKQGKGKAHGNERVMYTVHAPCWDAKNRYGLPDEAPFDYAVIAPYIDDTAGPVPAPISAAPAPKTVAPAPESAVPASATTEKTSEVVSAPVQPEQNTKIENTAQPENVSPFTQKPPNIPDALPQALKDLMRENSVDEFEIRNLVANKGFYPLETPITNYDSDFINGALIASWDELWPLIRNERDLPF